MIVESIVLSVAVVFVASVHLTKWCIKREDRLNGKGENWDDQVDGAKIPFFPFFEQHIGNKCPMCGMKTELEPTRFGIDKVPAACKVPNCGQLVPHLHGRCVTCKGRFCMGLAQKGETT